MLCHARVLSRHVKFLDVELNEDVARLVNCTVEEFYEGFGVTAQMAVLREAWLQGLADPRPQCSVPILMVAVDTPPEFRACMVYCVELIN